MKKIRIQLTKMHYLWVISVILLGVITIIGSNGGGDGGGVKTTSADGTITPDTDILSPAVISTDPVSDGTDVA